MECGKLNICPFFAKHKKQNPVICESISLRFCKGPEHLTCARLEFYKMYGFKPNDDMTPMGELLVAPG